MKTYQKTLFYKEFVEPIAYGYKEEHKVRTYIKVVMYFDFKEWLRFSVGVANMGSCHRNPFKAFLRVLEHESVGMAKYQQMKDDARSNGVYKLLNPDFINGDVNN